MLYRGVGAVHYCWDGLLLDIYHISVRQSIYRLKKWAKPTPKHHLLSCKYATYTAVQVKVLIFVKYYRVQKELKQLQSLKPHGIEVSIPSDSLQLWEAMVPGPEESLYKGINPCTGAKSKHWAPEVMQLSSFSWVTICLFKYCKLPCYIPLHSQSDCLI